MPTDDPVTIERVMSEPPAGRLVLLRADGDVEATLLRLSEEADRIAADDVVRGLEVREALVAIADEFGAPIARAETRRGLVESLANVGKLAESAALGEQALEIAEAFNLDSIVKGRVRLAQVRPLLLLARFDDASELASEALGLFEAVGEPQLAARAYNNLGTVAESRGDLTSAITYFDLALEHIGAVPEMRASVQSNRGLALLNAGRLTEAEAAFLDASSVARSADMSWVEGIALQNLAFLSVSQGKYARAMRHFEAALQAFESDGAETDIALLRLDQAKALLSLGLLEPAITEFERAASSLDRLGFANEAAEALEGIGQARLRSGDLDAARSALTDALLRYRTLGVEKRAQWTQLHLAQCESAVGDLDDASSLIHGVIDEAGADTLQRILGEQLLSRIGINSGKLDEARDHVRTGLAMAQQLDLAPPIADLLAVSAEIHRIDGDLEGEGRDLRQAVDQIERVRGALQADRFRSAWLGNRVSIYDQAIRNALDRGTAETIAEAFSLAERVKGRVLLDQIDGALDVDVSAGDEDPAQQRIATRLTEVQASLNWQYSQLSSDDGFSAPDSAWQSMTRELEAEADQLRDRLATTSGLAALYAPTASIAEVQGVLAADEALVEYATDGDALVAFVVRRGEVRVFRHLGRLDEIAALSERVMFQIGRGLVAGTEMLATPRGARLITAVNAELHALHTLLIAPLAASIADAQRLTVVPHGPIHGLPLAALHTGERYLCQDHLLTIVSSASLLLMQRQKAPRDVADLKVLIGVPDPIAPRIAEEVTRIQGLMPESRVLLGDEATVGAVTEATRKASLAHFACHGRFDPANPRGSGLKLADRWLTVREIPSLRTDADLVVLSGCETGRAGISGADELVGLVQALLAGGIRTVVYSLWIVNDGSTMELMDVFYRSMVEGQNAAEALRTAECAMISAYGHPAFWAPFVAGGQA